MENIELWLISLGISGNWLIAIMTAAKVLSVEFIDKSFLLAASAAGARKNRKIPIFLAAYIGIMINMVFTIALGVALPTVSAHLSAYGPKVMTAIAAVILFFISIHLYGIWKWLPELDLATDIDEKRLYLSLMTGVFLAELGDLTQFQVGFTAMGLSSFFAVLAGAGAAFAVTMFCAVTFGEALLDSLKEKIGEENLHRVAATICLLFSIYFFWSLVP